MDVVKLGSRLVLFVDTFLIEKQHNTRLVLHEPDDAGSVLHFDRPWEGALCGYATVIKDDTGYRLYYRGIPEAGKDGSDAETTCYAESEDGVNWTRPDLGIHRVAVTFQNNVILANAAPVTHNFSPFFDTREGIDPRHKYKALGGNKKSGLMAYGSEDGIHWNLLQEEPVFTEGIFDSQNVSFWSPGEQKYLCYFRTWKRIDDSNYRTISRTTSRDFIHWTDPVEMDFGDTPPEHLYTNQTSPYFRAPITRHLTWCRQAPMKCRYMSTGITPSRPPTFTATACASMVLHRCMHPMRKAR
jgi:hypothetical protein